MELRLLFEAMPESKEDVRTEDSIWKRQGDAWLGVVASPNHHDELKRRLATYFAVRRALPIGFVSEEREPRRDEESPAWRAHILRHAEHSGDLEPNAGIALMEAVQEATAPNEVLPVLANRLGFSETALAISMTASDVATAFQRYCHARGPTDRPASGRRTGLELAGTPRLRLEAAEEHARLTNAAS